MFGIVNAIIKHSLCVNLDSKKVMQKRMAFSIEKSVAFVKEVDRLLAA